VQPPVDPLLVLVLVLAPAVVDEVVEPPVVDALELVPVVPVEEVPLDVELPTLPPPEVDVPLVEVLETAPLVASGAVEDVQARHRPRPRSRAVVCWRMTRGRLAPRDGFSIKAFAATSKAFAATSASIAFFNRAPCALPAEGTLDALGPEIGPDPISRTG
jgi:hypothetical protein